MLGAKSSIASKIGLLILKNKLIYILLKFAILYLIILAGCWHTARVYWRTELKSIRRVQISTNLAIYHGESIFCDNLSL